MIDPQLLKTLKAIAHDLHRIADALEPKPVEYRPDVTMRRTTWFPVDQPGPGNVEADYTEDGQLIPPRKRMRLAGEPLDVTNTQAEILAEAFRVHYPVADNGVTT